MIESKVTCKGQINLPKSIRDHLHLKAGQRVGFEIDERGLVRLPAKNVDLRSLRGIVKAQGRRRRLSVGARNEVNRGDLRRKVKGFDTS